MKLYRPVSKKELCLICENDFTRFPPCSPTTEFFYAKVKWEQAEAIARGWSIKSSDNAGFVARFEVEDSYIEKFPIQTTGSPDSGEYQSLCIPTQEVEEFNLHIVGRIRVEVVDFHSGLEDAPATSQ